MAAAVVAPPVWLLDVDGVINAIAGKGDPSVWPRSAWTKSVADGWPILTAAPVLDFIRAVHAAGAAEIRWHTTWQERAQTILADLLDLPTFPLQPAPELDAEAAPVGGSSLTAAPWWKLPAAFRVLNVERRRLVWTDDDLRGEFFNTALGGLPLGTSADCSSLLVSPRTTLGLAHKELTAIAAFLDRPDLAPAAS